MQVNFYSSKNCKKVYDFLQFWKSNNEFEMQKNSDKKHKEEKDKRLKIKKFNLLALLISLFIFYSFHLLIVIFVNFYSYLFSHWSSKFELSKI